MKNESSELHAVKQRDACRVTASKLQVDLAKLG